MKSFIIVVLGLSIFVGCGGGDWSKKLPNNYLFSSEAPKQEWIMQNPLLVDSNAYIPCEVLIYNFNKKYIIAKIKFHYDVNCVVGFKESKILKEGQIYYYIIDTEKHIRYGAFEKEKDYLKKMSELKINNLILE